MKNFIKVFLLTVFPCLIVNLNAQVSPAEKQALQDLYNATNGANWDSETDTDTSNDWNFSGPVTSDWEGITVVNGHVTAIQLLGNDLAGTIPASIDDLSFLEFLSFQNNDLSGPIPAEIGNLTNLTGLYLSYNSLSGQLPTEIGNLINLTSLSMASNDLNGTLPTNLGNLVNLTYLALNNNDFSGPLPSQLTNLVELKSLYLNSNQFNGAIPSAINNLVDLENLSLDNNDLTGAIPSSLGSLSNLKSLNLYSNDLSGAIPSTLGNLSNLTNLRLFLNDLTGPIPIELGSLSSLAHLYLYGNQLTGTIPDELGDLTNLVTLSLFNNNLSGSIPTSIENLTLLKRLTLNNNNLTGGLPAQIGSLANLEVLQVHDNGLTGNLPTEIGNLGNLKSIYLYNNQFSGAIPSSIGNLINLTNLRIQANQFSGTIPTELGNLTDLVYLSLYDNQLNGAIPSSLGNLGDLTNMNLRNNQLSGSIPQTFENLFNIRFFDFENNNLSGTIPNGLADLPSLITLDVQENSFEFGSLEYTFQNSPDFQFYYRPQAKMGPIQSLQVEEGGQITLSTNVSGAQNHYQWYKDGQPIAGAPDDASYVISNASLSDAGTYHCLITSDIITNLTLTRNNITLTVTPEVVNNNPMGPGDTYDESDWNTITTWSWDLQGNLKASNRSYFDCLGKLRQTQTWDVLTQDIWAQETVYDYQGRPTLSTLSAPIYDNFLNQPSSFQFNTSFITDTGSNSFAASNFDTAATKYDPDNISQAGSLGKYYQGQTSGTYQDITSYPYSRTIFSELNPGKPLAVLGGNKVDTDKDGDVDDQDSWAQGYSFTMKASWELTNSLAFDDTDYRYGRKVMKTVTRDVHGNENVVFTDTDGKVLAAARSGGNQVNRNFDIPFGDNHYVDIHIPQGITGFSIKHKDDENTLPASDYTIYNLITEEEYTESIGTAPPGFYRVATTENRSPFYVVSHSYNYYDYNLNEYDEADRLTASYQPLTDSNGNKLVTTYEYNTLGQLIKTTSPDEGTAEFKYREDGQIRYSQNTVQVDKENLNNGVVEYSYTNYDELGRPTESGVAHYNRFVTRNFVEFKNLEPDNAQVDPAAERKERQFTQYDYLETDQLQFLATVPGDYANPSFLAGNVAMTKNDQAETFYSYDIYGRVKWLVQNIEGLGFMTIDYKYHPITGLVQEVTYQKGQPEHFTHTYTYNERDQLIRVGIDRGDAPPTPQAEYFYNEAGTLVRTELAEGAQGIDYVYNLAGQLKSINHPSLSPANDPRTDGQPGDANDLFGMQIDYHTGDYNRTANSNITNSAYGTDQLNGNIKGVRWNTAGTQNSEASEYVYSYDRNNWLTSADFDPSGAAQGTGGLPATDESTAIYTSGQTADLAATQSFTLKPGFHAQIGSTVTVRIDPNGGGGIMDGDYDVSNITYDANGNILTLTRNRGSQLGDNAMDDLVYNYKDGKPNQLEQVVDNAYGDGDAPQTDDIASQTATENYAYNTIGQLIENKEENIAYFYNASGLVTEVQQNGAPMVKFFYNDRNHRVKKEDHRGASVQTTYYVRDVAGQVMAIYSDNNQTSTMALTEQPIYGTGRIGVAYNNGQTVYELTDHLGNVRALFTKENVDNGPEGYTDYYPFGMPMPQRSLIGPDGYRYAFQGQEKDSETGKEAFELRLWDSRIGRWLTTDPYREFASPYLGMGNNPISLTDPNGGMTDGCCDDWRTDQANELDGFTGTQYTNAKVPTNFSSRVDLFGIVGAEHLKIPDQYTNWQSSFDGNLADYNQEFGTNYGSSQEAYADWNYTFNYAVQQREHILSIHEATGDAAEIIGEAALWIAPGGQLLKVGRLGLNGGRNLLGRYFIHTSKLHPRLYSISAKGNGIGLGQFDAAHRATTFLRNDILLSGRIGVRNYNTIFFNYRLGTQNFSIGLNPWKRTIFHEGPGIFR